MTFNSALDRAAVLLKSLSKGNAAKILSLLETEELRAITSKTNKINELDEEAVNLARRQFIDHATRLTESNSSPQNLRLAAKPFGFLEGVSNSVRFELLRSEHPIVIASVLSFLSTDAASELLLMFESQYRVSILKRLCQIKGFEKAQIEELSLNLRSRLDNLLEIQNLNRPGYSIASKILSCADPQTRETLLTFMENENQIAAKQIRNELFQFDDILNLRDCDVKVVLQFTDTSLWAPALQNAAIAIQRKVLNNVSERPRNILKNEIRNSRSVDEITANQARLHIVKSILKLSSENLIQLDKKPRPQQHKAA